MDSLGTALLDALHGVGPPEIYGLVLLAALAETTILADAFIPGEVAMALAGVVAATGAADPAPMIAAAAVGATIGDSVSYLVGRHWGLALVCRIGFLRRTVAPELGKARRFFGDHGGPAVFFGRFVGFLRALVPVAAGMARMRWRRFLGWNAAASVTWAGIVITLGFVFGEAIADLLERAGTYVLAGGVAVIAALVIHRITTEVSDSDDAADDFCNGAGDPEPGADGPRAASPA